MLMVDFFRDSSPISELKVEGVCLATTTDNSIFTIIEM